MRNPGYRNALYRHEIKPCAGTPTVADLQGRVWGLRITPLLQH
jgi:hypothetical protein